MLIGYQGFAFVDGVRAFQNIYYHQFPTNLQKYQIMDIETKEVVVVQGKLKKIIHQTGSGEPPQKGQEIHALYKGTLEDGTPFDSCQDRDSPFTFSLGQGSVIKGWDQGFASMLKGERATLICSPEYAYGERGSPPKIPPNAILHFQVELLDFKEKKKEKWQYSDEEKLEEAKKFKQNGNDKLKEGNYKEAVGQYKEGMQFVEYEHSPEAKQLLNILRLNSSQASLKLGKYSDVIENCSKVLKEEEDCHKALYRRGVAYGKIQDFDKARDDLKSLLKHDPTNADAKKELLNIVTAIKQLEQKEKKVFGNIFAKAGLYDDVKSVTEIKPEVKKVESESDDQAGQDVQGEIEPAAQNVAKEEPAVEVPVVEDKKE